MTNANRITQLTMILALLIIGYQFGRQTDVANAQNQSAITTPARVTGDASAHALATTGTARWVLVVAEAGNTDPVRCGDANVTATRGIPIYTSSTSGGGVMLPPSTVSQSFVALNKVYCIASSGDKFSWAWGN